MPSVFLCDVPQWSPRRFFKSKIKSCALISRERMLYKWQCFSNALRVFSAMFLSVLRGVDFCISYPQLTLIPSQHIDNKLNMLRQVHAKEFSTFLNFIAVYFRCEAFVF